MPVVATWTSCQMTTPIARLVAGPLVDYSVAGDTETGNTLTGAPTSPYGQGGYEDAGDGCLDVLPDDNTDC